MDSTDHSFGFAGVSREQKKERVAGVFRTAASHYDLMNDVMSCGLHRIWKRMLCFYAAPDKNETWLDLACGSGDVSLLLAEYGAGKVVAADPGERMLAILKGRIDDHEGKIETAQCTAEDLPFDDDSFHGATCAFGVRNFTDIKAGLAEAVRVLRPGGRMFVLEFSKPCEPISWPYRRYLLDVLPFLGKTIAQDEQSYRYLGESILVHPAQREMAGMMEEAGLHNVSWTNFSCGIVAIHRGWKLL